MYNRLEEGPYVKAAYIEKLRATRVLALTDLDGTMTIGDGKPSPQELADRRAVRQLLERTGVPAGAITARTCGLTLSSEAYDDSPEIAAFEPPPKWGLDADGRHAYVPIERFDHFDHCLNWDFMGSFGGHIGVRNGKGYKVDLAYDFMLRFDYARGRLNPDPWRFVLTQFLVDKVPDEILKHRSKIEVGKHYHEGVCNVAPLDFRYQFDFYGSEGLQKMLQLKEIIQSERQAGNMLAIRIAEVDESRICREDPEQNKYTLYLIPWQARKEKMVHRILALSAKAAGVEVKDLKLLYAGDTLTDLRTGLYAGGDAELAFLLPSGSRLAPYLLERSATYGNEDLSFLWANPTKEGRKRARLVPTNDKGVYRFEHKIRGLRRNTIVIGDERYPGTAPGSVAKFFREFMAV